MAQELSAGRSLQELGTSTNSTSGCWYSRNGDGNDFAGASQPG